MLHILSQYACQQAPNQEYNQHLRGPVCTSKLQSQVVYRRIGSIYTCIKQVCGLKLLCCLRQVFTMSLKLVAPLRASRKHDTSSKSPTKSPTKSRTKSRNKSTTNSNNSNNSKGEKERESKSKSKRTKTTQNKNTKAKGAGNSPSLIIISECDDIDMNNTPQGPNDNIRSGSNETVASTFMAQYNRPNLDLGFEFELSIFV